MTLPDTPIAENAPGLASASTSRAQSTLIAIAIGVVLVAATLLLRGDTLANWNLLNPDEAELMAQSRAAMLSPVPFTTWTMGTTGPFWVYFLAILGWIGLPLTMAFGHLLASLMVAAMGFVVFVLARRSLGTGWGIALAAAWWLPIVLIFPVGGVTDFGALNTELLPCLLVLIAATIPPRVLGDRPLLFAVLGLVCGLAVGSKYQMLPVAGALAIVVLIQLHLPAKRWIIALLLFAAGAILPFLVIVVAVATSADVSFVLLQQNLGFLGSYAGGVDIPTRFLNTFRSLSHEPFLLAALLVVVRLAFISSPRIAIARAILIVAGLLAVLAGGMGFDHYLYILFAALALAATLPTRAGQKVVPGVFAPRIVAGAVAIVVIAPAAVGVATSKVAIAGMSTVAATLSPASVNTDQSLAHACPPGSKVLVWGWAPELYVNYAWKNSVPFMSTLVLTTNPANYLSSRPLVAKALTESDCVVDAVGPPFFAIPAEGSISLIYPESAATLKSDYAEFRGTVTCDSCRIYIRD